MLPLAMLRNRNFAGANLLTLLLYAALGGGLFFLPLNLIQVQGLSATAAGAALLPFIVLMFLLSRWAGGLVDALRRAAAAGDRPADRRSRLRAAGAARQRGRLLGLPAGISVLGLGMAIAVAPLTTTVMNSVGKQCGRRLRHQQRRVARGGLLAIAVFGWLMASVLSAISAWWLVDGRPAEAGDAAGDGLPARS
jgi:hypothetical protein